MSRVAKLRGTLRGNGRVVRQGAGRAPRLSAPPSWRTLDHAQTCGEVPGPAVWNAVMLTSATSLYARLNLYDRMEAQGVVRNAKTYTQLAEHLTPNRPMAPYIAATLLRTMRYEAWPPTPAFIASVIPICKTDKEAEDLFLLAPTTKTRNILNARLKRSNALKK